MEFLKYITYIEYIIFFEDYFKTTHEDLLYDHYHTLKFYFYFKSLDPHNQDFKSFFDCINKGYYYDNNYRLDIFYSYIKIDQLIGEKIVFMEIEIVNDFMNILVYCKPFKFNTQLCIEIILTFMMGKF